MWGTSSPDDELTGDFGNVIEATQIAGRRLVRLVAGNLLPGNFWTFATQSAVSGLMHRTSGKLCWPNLLLRDKLPTGNEQGSAGMATVGSGAYTYEPVENWAKLPPGGSGLL